MYDLCFSNWELIHHPYDTVFIYDLKEGLLSSVGDFKYLYLQKTKLRADVMQREMPDLTSGSILRNIAALGLYF